MTDEHAAIRGNLLEAARRHASAMRSFANSVKDHKARGAELRQAQIVEELIRYAQDRDKEIVRLVHEAALLRAELESRNG